MKFRKGEQRAGGGVGLKGSQILEGVTEKEGGEPFFQGGCTFHIKNKLKSATFNDQKSL